MFNFFFKDSGNENVKKGEENEALSISNINIETKEKKKQEDILEENQRNYNENVINIPNNTINATYNEDALQRKRKSKRDDIIDDGDLVYNPDQFPPEMKLCFAHQNASRVSFPMKAEDGKKIDVCECCGSPVENTLIPVCIDNIGLKDFGVGIPLYFQFILFSIVISLIGLVVFGGYMLYDNQTGKNCIDASVEVKASIRNQICFKTNAKNFSYFNKLDLSDRFNIKLQSWISLGCSVLIIIIIQIIRNTSKTMERECDIGSTTASDYTVVVSNLPGRNYTKQELEEEMKKWVQKSIPNKELKKLKEITGVDIKIERILPGYEINRYNEVITQKRKLVMLRKKAFSHKNKEGAFPEGFNEESTQQKIDELAKELDKIEEGVLKGEMDLSTNYAFVTFSKATEALLFTRFYKITYFQKFFQKLRELTGSAPLFSSNLIVLKNKVLWISRADEPDDVMWKNLGFSDAYKIKKRIIAALVNTAILIVCLAAIFGLSYLQKKVNKDNEESTGFITILIQILNVVISLVILVINTLLKTAVSFLGGMERHSSMANYNSSVSTRLCFATFANTAITPLVANLYASDNDLLYVSGGLIDNIFVIILSNAISMPFLLFLNPAFYMKLWSRHKIKKEGAKCLTTQSDANKIFENLNLDLSIKYPAIIRTLWVTFFYASLIPLGLVFTFVGFVLYYFVEKYTFLRRTTKPPSIGSALNSEMIEMLEYTPLLLSGGNLLFTYLLLRKNDLYNLSDNLGDLIAIGISLINILFPVAKLHSYICPNQTEYEDIDELYPYQQARFLFPTDYDKSNPLTHDKALNDWIDLVENHGVNIDVGLIEKMKQVKKKGKSDKGKKEKKEKKSKKEKYQDNNQDLEAKTEDKKNKKDKKDKKEKKDKKDKKDKKSKDKKGDKEVVFQKVEVVEGNNTNRPEMELMEQKEENNGAVVN